MDPMDISKSETQLILKTRPVLTCCFDIDMPNPVNDGLGLVPDESLDS